jgi:hypothetical protein
MTKAHKYQVRHSFKNTVRPESPFGSKTFASKKDALKWIDENKTLLYWFQITEINAKSKHPKPILNFEPGDEYVLKLGTLQLYYETGMECLGLIFYEDGIYGDPNPDFDPSKPEDGSNFRYYSSYKGMFNIEKDMILEIDGQKIGMVKDRDFAIRDGHRFSFYPAGFSRKEIINLFGPENVKVRMWIKKSKLETK